MRTREEIVESVYDAEVKIGAKRLAGKTVNPLKLNIAILETLLDIRDQNKSK